MKTKPGDILRTNRVKHSDLLALVIKDLDTIVLVSRLPRLSVQEFVPKSCIIEICSDYRMISIEDLLTDEREWVRRIGKIKFDNLKKEEADEHSSTSTRSSPNRSPPRA